MAVYLLGQISGIKDEKKWFEYKSKVGETLQSFGAKLLFRGNKTKSLINSSTTIEIVSIEFESKDLVDKWFESESYQNLVSIREEGAEVTLELYE